jgi:hypothetical protein
VMLYAHRRAAAIAAIGHLVLALVGYRPRPKTQFPTSVRQEPQPSTLPSAFVAATRTIRLLSKGVPPKP